jgi:CubicO group peptidase (beta-lactamase class C family)
MKRLVLFSLLVLLVPAASLHPQSPVIQQIIDSVRVDSLIFRVKELSGKVPAVINGTPQTILSRHKAHYDDIPEGPTAPGADDDASGTAGVLEAARVLVQHSFPLTIVCALWDEEEIYPCGSPYYYTVIGCYGQLHFPAHSLKSSAEDFSHFLIAYVNGGQYRTSGILSEKTVAEILTMRNPASGLCLLWDCDLGNWYGHSGGEPGVSTRAEFQRDARVGVLILSNTRNKLVYPGTRIHALIRREAQKYLNE